MKFRVLGSLEVHADGAVVPMGGMREQAVLAVLVLEAGRAVPVTRLIDAIWADNPPETAAKQVRNAVSRLRRLLAPSGEPDLIVADGAGYRLSVSREDIDAWVFEAKVLEGSRAAEAGRLDDAAATLRSALALWRGRMLDGVGGPVLEGAATAWDERRRAAEDSYYEHMLGLGRYREVTSELSGLLSDSPLREKTAAQLMLALYRCGRQADALEIYQAIRSRLHDDLGLEPGPELQRLHQQILGGDAELDIPSAEEGTQRIPAPRSHPPASRRIVPRQLPIAISHFAGRAGELTRLDGFRHATSMVVITAISGTAGVGKTALALHWAHKIAGQFPDGQLYVNMRGFDPAAHPMEPSEAIREFLYALGIPPSDVPLTLNAASALYRSVLAGKRMLVLLDNARDADQVRPLLPGSSDSLAIVTSRRQLPGLIAAEGASLLNLDVLSDKDAAALLAARLGNDRAAAEPEAVVALSRLCARLPLALAVAAARAAMCPELRLADLAAELTDRRDRLDVLGTGDVYDIRDVLSWSCHDLRDQAARMFRLLALHPGPDVSVAAAASLASAPPSEARAALRELGRASLINEHAPGRYAFHDLLRAYAAEQAQARESAAENSAATLRMLDHYLHTACSDAFLPAVIRHEPIPLGAPQPGVTPEVLADDEQALTWFETEHKVLLGAIAAATEAGFDGHVWRLSWALGQFLNRCGYWQEWASILSRAVAAAERAGDVAGQAHVYLDFGRARMMLDDDEDAEASLRQALGLYEMLSDRTGQARSLHFLGQITEQTGRIREALGYSRRALSLYRAAGNRAGQATALNSIGWLQVRLGNYRQAIGYCQRSVDMHQRFGNAVNAGAAWDSLGHARYHLGQYTEAIVCYEKSIELFGQVGDFYSQAKILTHLGEAQQVVGDQRAARRAFLRALATFDELEDPAAEEVRDKLAQLDAAGGSHSPSG